MWEMNHRQRAGVLTRGKNNRYVRALNKREDMRYFSEKTEFLKAFAPYIGRRWLDLREADAAQLEEMLTQLGVVLVKPQDATHGDGVEKIYDTDVQDYQALLERLRGSGQTLCEEVICQHPDLDELWSGCINTVRLVTIYKDGVGHIVASFLRVGSGEKPVDNFNSGGMVTPLDPQTGVALCRAVNKAGVLFEGHPITGTVFEGFQVPLWEQVTQLVKEAAGVIPGVRYVGWDVAVTPTGPVLVEGNQYPGHDIYGLPGQSADQMAVLSNFEKVISLRELKKLK